MARIFSTLLLTIPAFLLASTALPRPASAAFSWPSFYSSLAEEDVAPAEVMKYKDIIESEAYATTDSAFTNDEEKPTKQIVQILMALGYEDVKKFKDNLISFKLDDDLGVFDGSFKGLIVVGNDDVQVRAYLKAPKFESKLLQMLWVNSWTKKKRFTTAYFDDDNYLVVEMDVVLSESVAANARVLKRSLGLFAISFPVAVREMHQSAKLEL
jgi:hypothetical protein